MQDRTHNTCQTLSLYSVCSTLSVPHDFITNTDDSGEEGCHAFKCAVNTVEMNSLSPVQYYSIYECRASVNTADSLSPGD